MYMVSLYGRLNYLCQDYYFYKFILKYFSFGRNGQRCPWQLDGWRAALVQQFLDIAEEETGNSSAPGVAGAGRWPGSYK